MYKFLALIVSGMSLFASAGCHSSSPSEKGPLKLISFNIRFNNPNDGLNIWENRIPLVQAYFKLEAPDIIGMQEVTHEQMLDLIPLLPGYAHADSGRGDSFRDVRPPYDPTAGEYSPVFFREDRFNLLDHGQFWLSESPHLQGSKGWDAALPRIVTWVELTDKHNGHSLFFFNTHFDHRGDEARMQSISLMSNKISNIAGNRPVLVAGDFNIRKAGGEGRKYNALITTFTEQNRLFNSAYMAPVSYSAGATFNGFNPEWKQIRAMDEAIDYIFFSTHFDVCVYRVDQVTRNGLFISDHWPVVSLVHWKPR